MVTLVGGYLLIFEQAVQYAEANDIPFGHPWTAAISINRWFRDKKILMPEFIAVPWRVGTTAQSHLLLATRMTDDNPKFQFTERNRDRHFKCRLLKYPGLENAEMKFVTVANPFGESR